MRTATILFGALLLLAIAVSTAVKYVNDRAGAALEIVPPIPAEEIIEQPPKIEPPEPPVAPDEPTPVDVPPVAPPAASPSQAAPSNCSGGQCAQPQSYQPRERRRLFRRLFGR